MFNSTSTRSRYRKALAGAIAAAALVPTAASARPDGAGYGPIAQQPEIPYLSWGVGITRPAPDQGQGGVTPTNLARALVTTEPHGPLLRNAEVTPLQTPTAEPAGTGGGFEISDVMLRAFVSVGVALAAAFALFTVRSRTRTV